MGIKKEKPIEILRAMKKRVQQGKKVKMGECYGFRVIKSSEL